MKEILLFSVLAFSSLTWASFPAPDATYTGKGQLTRLADGTNFSYDVNYVINGQSITANYAYPNGFSYSLPFTAQDGQFGQFTVQIQGQTAGSGWCIGDSCHVDLSYPLNGVLNHVSLAFSYVDEKNNPNNSKNQLIVSGNNTTTNTVWEDRLNP